MAAGDTALLEPEGSGIRDTTQGDALFSSFPSGMY